MKRYVILFAVMALAVGVLAAPSGAQQAAPDRLDRPLPDSIQNLKLDSPITVSNVDRGVLDTSLVGAVGDQQVIVQLTGNSLAESGKTSDAAQAKVVRDLNRKQDRFVDRVEKSTGATEIARVQRVLNAVFLEVDASQLTKLAADPDVVRIAAVGNYELDLSETVPYIGGTAVQNAGFDGSDIKVAVLDSGIDYTHAAFGGTQDYDAAYADPASRDGLFPTAKVAEGYDFVGEVWPGGPLAPDPDPIDFEGHGTHVADIIGGLEYMVGPDTYGPGVAPGVDLYAVKVCSAVSSACSGVALIQGMEFAVDPNMDGKAKDRVDIINMSLGSDYGQPFDDDLSAAVDGATALGVLTVSSAGNGGDKPFIVGSPASARTALSVAQTQVPSASLQLITAGGLDYPAVFQPWSAPPNSKIAANVVYGADYGSALGCSTDDINSVDPTDAPYPPGTFSGEIVLVDRGACNFSIKIYNIQRGGGSAGIIGLVAPGAPFAGAFGAGGPYTIPGYMINQADSNAIKAALPTSGAIDPDNQLALVGQMVGSSSRGPQSQYLTIKPEIGAPGASVSAIVGTGDETGPFGGTSGASPMIAGSAALLLDGYGGTMTTGKGKASGKAIGHGLDPLTVKALLMNNGETNIDTDPFTGLAPIARIGGGEVRVDRALGAPVAAFDSETYSGALSFGYVDVADGSVTLTKTVTIRNLNNKKHTYEVSPTFRFNNDVVNGAVSVSAPTTVTVKPGLGRETTFEVSVTIDGSMLRDNSMNSGSLGADPDPITEQEYDGYLILDDGDHPIHLAWHVLPRKAARVVPDRTTMDFSGGPIDVIGLTNTGVGTAQNDGYSLMALSPEIPEGPRGAQSPTPDLRAVGIQTYLVDETFCTAGYLMAIGVNTWEPQTHAISPVNVRVDLDTDLDGISDATVLTGDVSRFGPSWDLSDGRAVTWVIDWNASPDPVVTGWFLAEHAMLTGNTAMYFCGEQIGSPPLFSPMNATAAADDIYFGGPGDSIGFTDSFGTGAMDEVGFTFAPYGERYFAFDLPDISGEESDTMSVFDFGPVDTNPGELGIMVFTNGDRGPGLRGGATKDTEALLFMAP